MVGNLANTFWSKTRMVLACRAPIAKGKRPSRHLVPVPSFVAPDGSRIGDRPLVMGVVNVTPDSFSDGGLHMGASAVEHARKLVADGADIVDVGAESTKPGSDPVPAAEQVRRLEDVLGPIVALGVPVSIDTMSAEVARWALDQGVAMVNDVSACRADPGMAPLAAERGCPLVLMHMLGMPKTMQHEPVYPRGVVEEVVEFLEARVREVTKAGVAREQLILDPGIGFGKTVEHNLLLIRELGRIKALGSPVMVGASRKWFIGQITGRPVDDRIEGSIAAAVVAVLMGADILRVHDVAETVPAVRVAHGIRKGAWP
jgi:dihydropteroate synthase